MKVNIILGTDNARHIGLKVQQLPQPYSIHDEICKKDLLGGGVNPLTMDSDCKGAEIIYSGPEGHDDVGPYGSWTIGAITTDYATVGCN